MRALPETAGGILGYFTRHATAANLLMALLLILGAAAIPNLRAQFFPDVVVERIFVNVAWDGAGAEDVDRAVVAVLEPSMLSVEGVVSVDSTSQEGAARIALEFEPGWDTAEAMDQVQLTLDQAQDLPDGTEDPVVYTTSWSDRVTDVVLTGPLAIDQLSLFADEFVTRLFAEGIT
ncbi:MAG: efflux RND transporter permease subunit, partial [Pseudomonadota bacterium]